MSIHFIKRTSTFIKTAFDHGYLMDPHTATCFKVYDTGRDNKALKTIVYSTAEWTKFSPVIAKALTGQTVKGDVAALEVIAQQANVPIPAQIKAVLQKPITQDTVVEKTQIEEAILAFLG